MKRLYSIFLFVFVSVSMLTAQTISVKSFALDEMDQTANIHGTTVFDQNGEKCALIKVVTTETGFSFDNGILGIAKTEQKQGEVWVYVPNGTRRLTINHNQLGQLRDYAIPVSIEPARTYVMQLITGKVQTVVENAVTQQYLVFQVKPENSMVEVSDEMWDVDRGQAIKYVPFGSYDWKVSAKNYHTAVGKVKVDNPDEKHIVNVELEPAFGWIEVSGADLKDASIYLDNELIGKAPFKSENIPSGKHTVTIKRPMYKAYTEEITINDGMTTKVNPSLSADFCNVTVVVDNEAEIWINGEKRGVSSWTGPLPAGSYNFETRKENHHDAQHAETIVASNQHRTITLPSPTPIYGSLNISTAPAMSQIFIDGQGVGETPQMIRQILIGEHKVVVKKDGYGDYTTTINIQEGQTTTVEGRLSDLIDVKFTSNVPKADLFVDGKSFGSSSGTYNITYGIHSLSLNAKGYKPYSATINVTQETTSFQIRAVPFPENKNFSVKGVSFTMIAIEGGTFTMGSSDVNSYPDERPAHNVDISDYYIGETEVTQSLWKAVMDNNPSGYKGANRPVENVSWEDCMEFISKLNAITGMSFRMPTEAEWEFAARGGNKSRHANYSGSDRIDEVAWISSLDTHEVKKKKANELGIYDMSGNVWEWCHDWKGKYPYNTVSNPQGPVSGVYRVYRGGCMRDKDKLVKVTYRGGSFPADHMVTLGFRLAM